MPRTTPLAFLCFSLFLAIWPLTIYKTGLPSYLKSDEPAYYLMALSLARDGDLRCDTGDLRRLWEEFPTVTSNLVLGSDDGWHTVYFGKAYIYPLVAAPLAALFGANGMFFLNMGLFLAMVWMGTSYLRRFNPEGLAALLSVGFFFLSSAFAYVFWLHPEVFNLCSVTACLYFGFHSFPRPAEGAERWRRLLHRLFNPATAPAWSGAALMLAAYNKPQIAALGIPVLVAYARERRTRALLGWVAAATILAVLLCLPAQLLTGHPSAYLGFDRVGYTVANPDVMPVEAQPLPAGGDSASFQSYSWLLRIPRFDLRYFLEDLGYFLWGRHTGIVPYQPLALLALGFFLLHERRSLARWSILAVLALVGLYFILWIPGNWHGGGGFVGNRYFVNFYPAFLFLVTRIEPRWLLAPGYALGGLLVGPLLFTPFGMPVPSPTLQAHVRSYPLRLFPREMSLKRLIPGYDGGSMQGMWFEWRKDAVLARGDELWCLGASRVELWMQSPEPLRSAVFLVRNLAPENRIRLSLEGDAEDLSFDGPGTREVELNPHRPWMVRKEAIWTQHELTVHLYRLVVSSELGEVKGWRRPVPGRFLVGAAISYLGAREDLDRDLYQVEWGACEVPERVTAGQRFAVLVRIRNRSEETWHAGGAAGVHLSYHWLDAEGNVVEWEGRRSCFETDIPPGAGASVTQEVWAPADPGRYTLELDPVFEKVAWFSERNGGQTFAAVVEVAAPPASAEEAPEEGPEP